MRHYSDEELERALFALPLEQPPANLRSSILAATVYQAPALVTRWELAGLLGTVAVIAWLCWMIVMGGLPLFNHSLQDISETIGRTLSNTVTLSWLAAGGATAIWLTMWQSSAAPVRERIARR
jgi:hypothetical protein